MFADEQLQEWPALRERCLQGDQAAWIQFDRWVRPCLCGTLRRLLGRRGDAGEVVQDVLIRLWMNDLRCFRCLDPDCCPISFLVTLGARLFVDGWRAKHRRRKPARPGVKRVGVMHSAVLIDRIVDHRLIPRAVQTAIDEFVKTLTAKGREVFLRVVLNVTAEAPTDAVREQEDSARGEGGGQDADGARKVSRAEERMLERMAVRFQKEAGVCSHNPHVCPAGRSSPFADGRREGVPSDGPNRPPSSARQPYAMYPEGVGSQSHPQGALRPWAMRSNPLRGTNHAPASGKEKSPGDVGGAALASR